MATEITFNGVDLQSSSIVTTEIQHEDIGQKALNIQKFSDREGGKISTIGFEVKKITLAGIIKGTSKADVEGKIDTLKKNLNARNKNLDIAYSSGTRRYKATCSMMKFGRKHYSIDLIDWEAEFIISDPPLGIGLDTSTLESLGRTASGASTTTMDNIGTVDYNGTFRPLPKVKITLTACNGIRRLIFSNTDDEGYYTRSVIENIKFEDGDIIIIDTKEGIVTLNGTEIEFRDGFPRFSLTNNRYNLEVVGLSYTLDLKIIYYDYWL